MTRAPKRMSRFANWREGFMWPWAGKTMRRKWRWGMVVVLLLLRGRVLTNGVAMSV